MKLHYKGRYNLDPDTLPHGEHKPGAVPFKEAQDTKTIALIATLVSIGIVLVLGCLAVFRVRPYVMDLWDAIDQIWFGALAVLVIMFPHEILHAICFKKDVYLYTNLKQGMLFVVGPETMSKGRFVFMSLLPNIVFGFIPYVIGMMFPNHLLLLGLGIFALGAGAGDYYNVFNALTQMPKGARTYLYKFNSYWYMPEK